MQTLTFQNDSDIPRGGMINRAQTYKGPCHEDIRDPDDLSEWADMQFLLWDAQRHAGISDEQITLAMVEKLAVNKEREWPEPKDGEPRLHIKEQAAAVVPDEDPRDAFERAFKMPKHVTRCGTGYAVTAYAAWLAHDFIRMWEGWHACRAAMLQAGNSPVTPDSLTFDGF